MLLHHCLFSKSLALVSHEIFLLRTLGSFWTLKFKTFTRICLRFHHSVSIFLGIQWVLSICRCKCSLISGQLPQVIVLNISSVSLFLFLYFKGLNYSYIRSSLPVYHSNHFLSGPFPLSHFHSFDYCPVLLHWHLFLFNLFIIEQLAIQSFFSYISFLNEHSFFSSFFVFISALRKVIQDILFHFIKCLLENI